MTRESMVGNETTSFVYVPKKRQRGQRHTAEITVRAGDATTTRTIAFTAPRR